MHSHHIALALADARVTDLQRAAITHGTAAMPPRRHRHRRALALVGLTAAVALATLPPTGAFARPPDDAVTPARDLRALENTSSLAGTSARQQLQSPDARDAADGRGTYNSPRVVFVKVPQPSEAAAPEPSRGIDWADAGIGAGSLLGLSLIGLGGGLVIVHRRRAAHDAPPVAGL